VIDPDRNPGWSPEAEVAVVSRRRRIVQPMAPRRAELSNRERLAVSVQILGRASVFSAPASCPLAAVSLQQPSRLTLRRFSRNAGGRFFSVYEFSPMERFFEV